MTINLTTPHLALLLRGLALVRLELAEARKACPLVSVDVERRVIDELERALREPGTQHAHWHNREGQGDGELHLR